MSAPHVYRISPKDPGAHLYEARLTVAEPDPAGQVLSLPSWIPGSYMIRDFAKHVVAISAESDGLDVPLTTLDKSRWQAAPVDRPLTVTEDIYAYDDSVRGAHLDTTHAYFNGPCVFLCPEGQEDRACEVEIVAPEPPVGKRWRVATSMRRKDTEEWGYGTYTVQDYAELIDHPVEIAELAIGEFDVRGIPHKIAIRGHDRADMARICHDLEKLCEQHMQLLDPPDDLDRYLFLLHAPGTGYGGLEHRWSSSNVCARDHLPLKGDSDVDDGYRTFLGLCSHEYFHLWNVKRMKPAAFSPYDLGEEAYTRLLWVFEGVTSYYDDLALVRSGLITPESYLELVGRTVTRVLRGAGRLRQTIAESSFHTWTKFYQQDANAANAIVSYYQKGSLVALVLDLKLRLETEGRVSLDDVMRACWQRWGQSGKGMPEDGFEQTAAEVSGLDLGDFFDAAVRGTGELPLNKLLAGHGVGYHLRAATGGADKGGKKGDNNKSQPAWLGAVFEERAGKPTVTVVHNGSPAELAGLAPGDVAVALDGIALTAGNADQRLRAYRKNERVELAFFRGDRLMRTKVRLAAQPETTCWLEIPADADEAAVARRNAWLQSG